MIKVDQGLFQKDSHFWYRNEKYQWCCMNCRWAVPSQPMMPALDAKNEQGQTCNQIIAAKIQES